MEDATRLIANLDGKLADLDHKVAAYRQDLADEFARHSDQLLRGLPESVSATVRESVALSLHKYPAISPALALPGVLASTDPAESPEPPTTTALGSAPGAPAAAAAAAAVAAAASSPPTAAAARTSTPRTAPGTGATPTSTAATTASRPAHHEDWSSRASRLPRPATPPHPSSQSQLQSHPHRLPRVSATDSPGRMSSSPDDREAELRGVFTPAFLPLLDITYDRMRPPPTPPTAAKPTTSRNHHLDASTTPTTTTDAATSTTTTTMDASEPRPMPPGKTRLSSSPQSSPPSSLSSSPLPATLLPTRPPAIRRETDDVSSSSMLSDRSDSKYRRSALRRSSSSSKPQSPRRVRFEVAGTEVLPTASPCTSSQDVRQPLSDSSHALSASGAVDGPAEPHSTAAILGLLDAGDNDPPPKKVSSSQALRALSRLPLDSATVWTPVTQESIPDPESEGRGADGPVEPTVLSSPEPTTADMQISGRLPPPGPSASPPRRPASLGAGRAATHPVTSWQDEEDSDDSSDGDFLSIAKPKSFANKKALVTLRPRSPSADPARRPVPAHRATADGIPRAANSDVARLPGTLAGPSKVVDDETRQPRSTTAGSMSARAQHDVPVGGTDYSDVFDFEAAEGMTAPRSPTPPQDDDSDVETPDGRPQPRETLHMYSTSPAVNIPHSQLARNSTQGDGTPAATSTPTATPATPSARYQVPAVGSYMGRPIRMPVVVDPAVHEQAATMGEFNTFVGGLDGRSGMDDGDLSSFRASLANVAFSGTPRSFTERMLMEERMGKRAGDRRG